MISMGIVRSTSSPGVAAYYIKFKHLLTQCVWYMSYDIFGFHTSPLDFICVHERSDQTESLPCLGNHHLWSKIGNNLNSSGLSFPKSQHINLYVLSRQNFGDIFVQKDFGVD